MSDKKGIEVRYTVKKKNDPTGKHDTCQYFVLDPLHDPLARGALMSYATAAEKEYPELAKELRAWVNQLNKQDRKAKE